MRLQAMLRPALQAIYPPQCLTCDAHVTTDFGFCGACWRETAFIAGLVCDLCGTPLPGDDPGHPVHCDDCLTIARPWAHGRAALLYRGNGRKLVLSLKHADRTDLARPAAAWMLRVAAPLIMPDMVVAPIPLHWLRLLTRRYNQSALLSAAIARGAGLSHCPDLLLRNRNTRSQEGRDRDGRFRNVEGALRVHSRHAARLKGRPVLLVDDVMTSGATLAAATEACHAAGASQVSVVVLARVAKDA
jgi:predicted amidophosphoribosyltransferase